MRLQRWIEYSLLFSGALGVGVWIGITTAGAVWQDWENWVFERSVHGEPAAIGDYLTERSAGIIDRIRDRWGPTAENPRIGVPYPPAPERHPRPVQNNALIGRLTIPRLHLSAVVREGTGEGTLSLSLGHIPGTSFPGQAGNVGVAGHRDMLFRGLRNVRRGDLIVFETTSKTYTYGVASAEIVKPRDVSVLNAGQSPELTLVTCYPFYYVGPAPERFIVKAQEISAGRANTEAGEHVAVASVAKQSDSAVSDRSGADDASAADRVSFNVSKNHSRTLAPGISLGVSQTDVICHCLDGWMWLMPDRRTIWLRDQSVREPVVFYSQKDGKTHELVITNVANGSVTGYLRVRG